MLKLEFRESLLGVLPVDEAALLCEVLQGGVAEVSVRLNPDKPTGDGLEPHSQLQCGVVPWLPAWGRYLSERPVFTADPLLHGGGYYVQEASSMMVGWVFDKLQQGGVVDWSEVGPRVLDLCAAPGGKSTLLASLARPLGGVVVANEVIRSRARILAENVQKWGLDNVAVTSSDASNFGALGELFDLVLVDAPCSGEGMFRKDPGARDQWSVSNVEQCVQRGRRIVGDVWNSLKEGGVMIYSTCTFNSQENELSAQWIAQELGGQILDLGECGSEVVRSDGGGYRLYPHVVRGEGFYVVAILKSACSGDVFREDRSRKGKIITDLSKSQLLEVGRFVNSELKFGIGAGSVYGFSKELYPLINILGTSVGLVYSGVMLGEFMHESLKPAHSLALYCGLGLERSNIAVSRVDHSLAMEYLRKGALRAADFEPGLSLVEYRGLGLGWIKGIGNRCNNLYPNNWRVMNV